MTALWFVVAAAGGGVGRHLISVHWAGRWPATLAVNLVGSFVLGVVLRHDPSDEVRWVIGTAACGSFTTFGGFVLQSVEASPAQRPIVLTANVVGSIGAASFGWWIGGSIG